MRAARAEIADLDIELRNADRLQASWAGPGSLVLGVRSYLGWIDVIGIALAATLLDAAFIVGYLALVGPGRGGCASDFCTPDASSLIQAAVLRWIFFVSFALLASATAVLVARRSGRNWQVFVTTQLMVIALVSQVCCSQIRHDRLVERTAAVYSVANPR